MLAELQNAVCLSDAARRWLPPSKRGTPVHQSVLARWAERGIIGPDSQRVYLETWRVGGQRMTSQAAIEAFLAALNAPRPSTEQEGGVAMP